jgi:hypothetical protein
MKKMRGAHAWNVLMTVVWVTVGGAQDAHSQGPGLTARVRAEVVDSVAIQLERMYVSPDTGRLIAERIRLFPDFLIAAGPTSRPSATARYGSSSRSAPRLLRSRPSRQTLTAKSEVRW